MENTEEDFNITLMKVLRKVKDTYYPNQDTYFDENLRLLEEKYGGHYENVPT